MNYTSTKTTETSSDLRVLSATEVDQVNGGVFITPGLVELVFRFLRKLNGTGVL